MRKKSKLVAGVGVNDADYRVTDHEIIDGKRKIVRRCPFYATWTGMLRRCYSDKAQERNPTYSGCTVSPAWRSFMVFRAWMLTQNWEGNQLDKDILLPGNKVYSPETCIFVTHTLNLLMTDCGAVRGEWPVGVDWHQASGKFESRCRNPFTRKREILGYFTCPDAAHESWRRRKHELAFTYADQQTDPRIADALRTRYVKHSE